MKHLTVPLLFSLLLVTGCKTMSYFNSPNDVFATRCILHFTDGSSDTGKISIAFETGHDVNSYISFTKNNLQQKIQVKNLSYYEVNGNSYYPKIVDVDLNGSENLLFVKRLTGANSRIHFFELSQKKVENSISTEVYNYFILFPNQDTQRPLNIASTKLTPNFDVKMSRFVDDCPELSRKIQSQARGYFLPSYSLGNTRKVDVFLMIINEYNACH